MIRIALILTLEFSVVLVPLAIAAPRAIAQNLERTTQSRSRTVLTAGTPKVRISWDAEAMESFRMAAENGEANAQRVLGMVYQEGRLLPKDDSQAALWYRKAAEQGDATAQWLLGALYDSGLGVAEVHEEAAFWYRNAAEQGLARAQWSIGSMYQRGRGVPQHDAKAAEWFRKSANQGNRGGQTAIGMMYERGQGVAEDPVRAFAWYDVAAKKGYSAAAKFKARLEQRMTAEQVAEAQDLSATLSERISQGQ